MFCHCNNADNLPFKKVFFIDVLGDKNLESSPWAVGLFDK